MNLISYFTGVEEFSCVRVARIEFQISRCDYRQIWASLSGVFEIFSSVDASHFQSLEEASTTAEKYVNDARGQRLFSSPPDERPFFFLGPGFVFSLSRISFRLLCALVDSSSSWKFTLRTYVADVLSLAVYDKKLEPLSSCRVLKAAKKYL